MAKEKKTQDIQNNLEDEIDLLELLQILIKRKTVIIALFLIATILGIATTLFLPKVYRGEFIISLPKKTFTKDKEEVELPIINPNDIINTFSNLKSQNLEKILPKDYQMIKDIKLEIPRNSTDKLNLIIESTNKDNISNVGRLLVDYMNQSPFIKDVVDIEKEKLQIKSEEINKIIKSYDEISNIMNKQLKEGKFANLGFNPLELQNDLITLKIEKTIIDKTIKDIKGLEIINEAISEKPVKPKSSIIIVVSMFIGLIGGIFLALFLEYFEKFTSNRKV